MAIPRVARHKSPPWNASAKPSPPPIEPNAKGKIGDGSIRSVIADCRSASAKAQCRIRTSQKRSAPMETGMRYLWRLLFTLLYLVPFSSAQETHNHPVPEKLGRVSFPISCAPAVQGPFDRGVALLHSFAYAPAEKEFHHVAELDSKCAMAHWGMAMTYFHQLWEPPIESATISIAQKEIQRARQIGKGSERERQFISALGLVYEDAANVPYATRALNYEHAMRNIASENRKDVETQVFYALALLANASPADKTHAKQKQAAARLETLYPSYTGHPGI